jgi:hypothetical protein
MFLEILRIRWYDLSGKYDGHAGVAAQPTANVRRGPQSRA